MTFSLTPMQTTIVNCAATTPGELQPSALAKLLAGTQSTRMAEWREHPDFGRLSHYTRKEILHQTQVLIQQDYLATDSYGRIVVGPRSP
ncbi:MAG: hypothetical protein M9918_06035 [Anaerolineae bacterium]|nr:hypothetical protein [Anaerolineae bacterium]MCO5187733.1 hypothetical protein [Anaerolineae bacterium]